MKFVFVIISFLSATNFPGHHSSSVSSKNLVDSFYILVRTDYPETFPADLEKNPFFIQQLLADFKQREKKQNKKFALFIKRDSSIRYDLVLNFSFYDLQIGEEKNEQSVRLATMKKMQTVFDKEAEQHKRQDVDYSADVTHVKRSIECTMAINFSITNDVDGPVLYKKNFNGRYNWGNEYVTYTGDKEAITDQELQLSKNRNQPTPSASLLYRELLKNLFKDMDISFDEFFQFNKGI